MKRVLTSCSMPDWFIVPAIGIMDMRAAGFYIDPYKYRIGFAWLCFRLSIGIMKDSDDWNFAK